MKTLFVVEALAESNACQAVLYVNEQGRESTSEMQFADAYAALDWCIEQRAGMVFTLANLPEHN